MSPTCISYLTFSLNEITIYMYVCLVNSQTDLKMINYLLMYKGQLIIYLSNILNL